MGMNDVEIWQSDHKGQKGQSRYRLKYGEVNDLGGYYTYNKDDAYCLNAHSGKSLVFNNFQLSRIFNGVRARFMWLDFIGENQILTSIQF